MGEEGSMGNQTSDEEMKEAGWSCMEGEPFFFQKALLSSTNSVWG